MFGSFRIGNYDAFMNLSLYSVKYLTKYVIKGIQNTIALLISYYSNDLFYPDN